MSMEQRGGASASTNRRAVSLDSWRRRLRASSDLERDAEKRPDLFRWHGPQPLERLLQWAKASGAVPPDLLAFWSRTGGGEAFETETFLSPFGDPVVGDDVEGVTAFHREKGLPREWTV